MPRCHAAALEGVQPILQQLCHGRLAKVLDADVQPLLEGVRVIG